MTQQGRDRIIDELRLLGEFCNDNPDSMTDDLAKRFRDALIAFWSKNDRRQANEDMHNNDRRG